MISLRKLGRLTLARGIQGVMFICTVFCFKLCGTVSFCGFAADVDEMPFELRNVAIDRHRCFADQFDIVDFLGRYCIKTAKPTITQQRRTIAKGL